MQLVELYCLDIFPESPHYIELEFFHTRQSQQVFISSFPVAPHSLSGRIYWEQAGSATSPPLYMVSLSWSNAGQVRKACKPPLLAASAYRARNRKGRLSLRRFEADNKVRVRFVAGKFQNSGVQAALDEEQRTYNDFQLVDVEETYENLVLKIGL